jgi:phosphopantetheine adenylyltransferase
MLIARTLTELRQHLQRFERPAFVPTMGNLHEGHLHLLQVAKPMGDVLVASSRRMATKACMIWILTCTAASLRSTADSMATPCSVNA